MASQDLPAPATLPGAGESRWPMALMAEEAISLLVAILVVSRAVSILR